MINLNWVARPDYLDLPGHEWPVDAPMRVRDDIRAHVAASPDLAWALRPPPRLPLWWRLREAVHLVGVPLLVLLVLPVLPVWVLLLRRSERRDVPDAARPAAEHLRAVAPFQDRAVQNPLSALTALKPGLLRRLTTRAVLVF